MILIFQWIILKIILNLILYNYYIIMMNDAKIGDIKERQIIVLIIVQITLIFRIN